MRGRHPRLLTFVVAAALLATLLFGACGDVSRARQQVSRIEKELAATDNEADASTDTDTAALALPPASQPKAAVSPTPQTTGPAPNAPTPRNSQQRAIEAVSGKGQYIFHIERSGTPEEIVAKAQAHGLRHLVIRAGNPVDGFYVADTLNRLLPLAHGAGIKVVAYDGPAMEDIPADVTRAKQIVDFTASTGDRVDALALDIEQTRAPNLDGPRVSEYGRQLRAAVGSDYPLIGIVMNPNYHLESYPFAEIAEWSDVLSPMNYWSGVTSDAAGFMQRCMELLARFGRPVSIIGQAYPIEGDKSYPSTDQFQAQMQAGKQAGAIGMSFWAWEYTRDGSWNVIANFDW